MIVVTFYFYFISVFIIYINLLFEYYLSIIFDLSQLSVKPRPPFRLDRTSINPLYKLSINSPTQRYPCCLQSAICPGLPLWGEEPRATADWRWSLSFITDDGQDLRYQERNILSRSQAPLSQPLRGGEPAALRTLQQPPRPRSQLYHRGGCWVVGAINTDLCCRWQCQVLLIPWQEWLSTYQTSSLSSRTRSWRSWTTRTLTNRWSTSRSLV